MMRGPSKQPHTPLLGHEPAVEKPCFKHLPVGSIWPDWFPTRLPLLAGMRLDSGSGRLRRGLLRQAEAPPTAERPQQRGLLGRLLRHAGHPVLGLRRPLSPGQHHGQRRHAHGQPQVRTSWTLRCQFGGLGGKRQGEIQMDFSCLTSTIC